VVVELAQLSRADRSSGWREPEMQDLKESGQLEQDADMIFMLYKRKFIRCVLRRLPVLCPYRAHSCLRLSRRF